MNVSVPRTKLEEFGRLVVETQRRQDRKLQSTRGWIDDSGVLQGGLMAFIRKFWHVLEPEAPLIEGWPLYAICLHLEAVTFGEITRLLITVPPGFMKSLCTDVFWPAFIWGPMNKAHERFVAFSYSASLTERDNERFRDLITHHEYQAMWGDRVRPVKVGATKVSNTKKGWKLASSVGGVGTGERGTGVILDDAHNIKEAESEIVRNETVRWFRESMSDRLNNMETGFIVAIMQRSHEDDVAGAILSLGLPYCHLMIEMELDLSRKYDAAGEVIPTDIGWYDPRLDDDAEDGELAWPDRFPASVVEQIRNVKGPYAYCNPYEAPVLMADLSLRAIGEVNKGSKVIGFTIGNNEKRARLTQAEVLSISISEQPIVKMTLESGETIRCTPDHKWWTGRNDKTHAPYAAAKVRSVLSRVCPPRLPELRGEDDIRLAGWLSGFFDGEGSVALNSRRETESSPLITFTQGDGRNGSLCDKLEYALTWLGFNWGVSYKKTLSKDPAATHSLRSYWLKMAKEGRASRFGLCQRFLHLVKPTKWRQRLIDAASSGRLYTQAERVVSIVPDGYETVYGLETTTGNYVVWGVASSNSGQYQQSPVPRGKGIFQREWWQVWDSNDGKFPVFDLLIASLDSAFTEKEQNDPSGLTVWGVFTHEGKRRVMLVHAWRKHLQFSGPRVDMQANESKDSWVRRTQKTWGLLEWVQYTCERFKIDRLLIEAKASGISAGQELQHRYGRLDFAVQLCPVKGDKVARALAVQATFSQQLVYAPVRDWSEMVIDEAAMFPLGKYDDLTDSMCQAIKYLRDTGMAETDMEVNAQEAERVMHKPRQKALYPV